MHKNMYNIIYIQKHIENQAMNTEHTDLYEMGNNGKNLLNTI